VSSIVFHDVSFSYDAAPDSLLSNVDFGVSEGWTGVIGPNGAGKTTILRLACGGLAPKRGQIDRPDHPVYCPQRTDAPMPGSDAFLRAVDGEAYRWRGKLGIGDDWLSRWETLSHGERKRLQIGTCLWLHPSLLAVDEPTNHLDRRARRLVADALRSLQGIGLLVSHDRELLDELCGHVLFIDPPHARLRSGGYTVAVGALVRESAHAREERTCATTARKRLEREISTRREHQRKGDRALSKRGIPRRDHDAKSKIDAARVTDGGAGKRLRQLEGRLQQATELEAGIEVGRPADLGIGFRGGSSPRNAIIRMKAGQLELGEGRTLTYPDLIVQPADRIALVGPNGSGKSTLLRRIVAELTPPENRVVYVPQEVSMEESAGILASLHRLPVDVRGRAMTWVSRLGADPARLLSSELPSPGEVRKLILARHLAWEPHLILMDEPTNHMDLPSIEAVEAALAEFEGGLLLVSHDERFLGALTSRRWETDPNTPGSLAFTLSIRSARSGTVDPPRQPS